MVLSEKSNQGFTALLFWGCIGGVCSAAAFFLQQIIWDHIFPGEILLSRYHDAHILVLFALVFALLGYFSGNVFATGKKTREILIGMISGVSTAFVFLGIVILGTFLSDPAGFSGLPVLFVEIFFLSIVIQTIAAWFHNPRSGFAEEDDAPGQIPVSKRPQPREFLFPLCAILAVLIIPPFLLSLGDTGPVPEDPRMCVAMMDRADVIRTDQDTLRIVMQMNPGISHDAVPSVEMYLDEKDVSNQSIISRSDLDVRIDPPDGLLFRNAATVILKGNDVSGNKADPMHLRIIVTYPDTGCRVMIYDREI